MRALLPAVAASLALAVAPASLASAAGHHKPPRADLQIAQLTTSRTGSVMSVALTVKNKGARSAKASVVQLLLSRDGVKTPDDLTTGSVATPKLKPHKSATLSGTAILPSGASGTFYLVTCADGGARVKEKKESNNCRASAPFTVTPPSIEVSAAAATSGGTVSAATTAGSCSGAVCTVPSGAATVTLTATPSSGYAFVSWSGASCGGTTDAQGHRVVVNATTATSCAATFAAIRTIGWTVKNNIGTVSGTSSSGTCTASGQMGGCTVTTPGTVTFTAGRAGGGYTFSNWTGPGACVSTSTVLTITDPASDLTCQAVYAAPA